MLIIQIIIIVISKNPYQLLIMIRGQPCVLNYLVWLISECHIAQQIPRSPNN